VADLYLGRKSPGDTRIDESKLTKTPGLTELGKRLPEVETEASLPDMRLRRYSSQPPDDCEMMTEVPCIWQHHLGTIEDTTSQA
jgi:hypothetical protein